MPRFQCEFCPTRHAKDEMIKDGIEKFQALGAILHGKKSRFRKGKIRVLHHAAGVIDAPKPCHFHVITVFRR